MLGEVGGLGWRAGASEVGRRGRADEPGGREAPRDQAAVGQPADADGQIEALFKQVNIRSLRLSSTWIAG